MFKKYLGKVVVRHAVEVTAAMEINQVNESTSTITIDSTHAGTDVHFKHYEPVKVGDFIVRLTETDTYHCDRKVFLERNEVNVNPTFDFGFALKSLKIGYRVARKGWNGTGMFVYYVPANQYDDVTNQSGLAEDGKVPYRAYLALKTAQNDIATWSPSTSDCLAEDWVLVP